MTYAARVIPMVAAYMALLFYFLTPVLFGTLLIATVVTFEGYRLSDLRMVKMALAVAIGLFGIVGAITVTTDAAYLKVMAAWFAAKPCPRPKPGEYVICDRP